MELLIVRHAESLGNANGDYSTVSADSLSPRGEEQASALADCLLSRRFDKIIVSPMERALQTIAPYLDRTHQRAEVWPEIAEACWHAQREEPADAWRSDPAVLPIRLARHFTFRNNKPIRPGGPQTFGEGLCRVHQAPDLILNAAGKQDCSLLMVSHGIFIRELLHVLLATPDPADHHHHDNCGMTSLTSDGGWRLNFCNQPTGRQGGFGPNAVEA